MTPERRAKLRRSAEWNKANSTKTDSDSVELLAMGLIEALDFIDQNCRRIGTPGLTAFLDEYPLPPNDCDLNRNYRKWPPSPGV